MENPYLPGLVKIKKVISEGSDVKTFIIDKAMSYSPGQFVEASVLNFGEAPFGISNYSSRHIELTVRNVGNLTNAMHGLKAGDIIGIRGPYGHGYPLEYMQGNNIILIAGGTGIVPLRSVIEYIQQHRADFGQVRMFFGFRNPSGIIYRAQIEQWKKEFEVNIIVDQADSSWSGDVGNTSALIGKAAPSNKGSIGVLCGPPVMIKFAIETLKKLGWNDDQIYVSMERLMQCGIGKCGHCMVGGKYICRDGPVFRYDAASWLSDG